MKVKCRDRLVIMLNDHSNPYIESTAVLSDSYDMPTRGPGLVYLAGGTKSDQVLKSD